MQSWTPQATLISKIYACWGAKTQLLVVGLNDVGRFWPKTAKIDDFRFWGGDLSRIPRISLSIKVGTLIR